MRLKEKKLLQKYAATLKKFSAQGAKKVEYSISNYSVCIKRIRSWEKELYLTVNFKMSVT